MLAADSTAAACLLPALPYRRGEVTRAAVVELAATLDDALRRRVPVSFRDPNGGLGVAAEVAALMGSVHGWDGEETAQALERYREGVERERALRASPAAPGARSDAGERRRA